MTIIQEPYLEGMFSKYQESDETDNSVLVSFENKEIFENAIQLSKLGSTQGDQSLNSTLEAEKLGNFSRKPPMNSQIAQESVEIACNEDGLNFSLHEVEDEMDESNHYQHPMIGERRVLGEKHGQNVKCLSVSKSNRLENTLKKFGAQQNQ